MLQSTTQPAPELPSRFPAASHRDGGQYYLATRAEKQVSHRDSSISQLPRRSHVPNHQGPIHKDHRSTVFYYTAAHNVAFMQLQNIKVSCNPAYIHSTTKYLLTMGLIHEPVLTNKSGIHQNVLALSGSYSANEFSSDHYR